MSELSQEILNVQKAKEEILVKEQLVLEKAIRSDDPSAILRAQKYWKDVEEQRQSNMKSFIFDPFNYRDSLGYKHRPGQVSYDTLRDMSRAPIIRSIINTRTEQVADFCQATDDVEKIGWTIRKKRKLFTDKKENDLTDEDKHNVEKIIEFLLNGGIRSNSWHIDSFESFIRKFVPDSLIIDQATFEVVRNRKGMPIEFLVTDGATFRLAESFAGLVIREDQTPVQGYYPAYVQIYQGLIKNEYYPWELCFGIRNPSSNIYTNGYGASELEDMIKIVTWMLYADTYNGKFFSQGAAPKGILKLSGSVNENRLKEFKQAWRAQVAGVQNAWKTPMLEADGLEWIDLQKSNNDMEFSAWQEYLIKLSCALYKIDPSEIGFHLSGGAESPVYEGNQEYRLTYSKDKGLKPLLRFIAIKLNKYIVNALDSRYEFVWTGLEENTDQQQLDNDIKKVTNLETVNEVRGRRNLPPLKDGDIILNSIYLQAKQGQQFGSPMGNAAVDNMAGESFNNPFAQMDQNKFNNENPFQLSEESEEENPFMKGFYEWQDKFIETSK